MSRIADAVARAQARPRGTGTVLPRAEAVVVATPRLPFRLIDSVGTGASPAHDAAALAHYTPAAAAVRSAALGRGIRTLLVVSAGRAEERARTTLGIARALGAGFGERVCVIDADVRARTMPAGATAAEVPVYAVGATVCAVGADAVRRFGLRPLVLTAAAAFKWVLVDAPPLEDGPCTLLDSAEGVLVVIGSERGSAARIRATIKAIGRSRVIGAVITTRHP